MILSQAIELEEIKAGTSEGAKKAWDSPDLTLGPRWLYSASLVAGVVELVDAPDSKSGTARCVGSIPTARTICSRSLAALNECQTARAPAQ